jgi:hypothetical protein
VVAVHPQQREGQARLPIAQLRQRAMLAAVFQRARLRPIGADVHSVEPPQRPVIARAAAQGDGVQLQPARSFLRPLAAKGKALAQEVAGPRAAAPAQLHPQRREEPIQRARADGPQTLAPVGVQPARIWLVSGQPFRHGGGRRVETPQNRLVGGWAAGCPEATRADARGGRPARPAVGGVLATRMATLR